MKKTNKDSIIDILSIKGTPAYEILRHNDKFEVLQIENSNIEDRIIIEYIKKGDKDV